MQHSMTSIQELVPNADGAYETVSDVTVRNSNVLTENDEHAGREFCREIVDKIVSSKLPKILKNNKELNDIVELHKKFEAFTLESMFTIVVKSMQMLKQLDIHDIYDMTGMVDIMKVQTLLQVQQNCMNLVATFNMHMRRLPIALNDMIHDIQVQQVIEIQSDRPSDTGINASSTPLAILLRQAEEQRKLDKQLEESKEPVEVPSKPTESPETSVIDENFDTNALDFEE